MWSRNRLRSSSTKGAGGVGGVGVGTGAGALPGAAPASSAPPISRRASIKAQIIDYTAQSQVPPRLLRHYPMGLPRPLSRVLHSVLMRVGSFAVCGK